MHKFESEREKVCVIAGEERVSVCVRSLTDSYSDTKGNILIPKKGIFLDKIGQKQKRKTKQKNKIGSF